MKRIDEFVLSKFTKLCHWLQEWTGYTNWTVAAIGCVVVIAQCLLCIMRWLWHWIPPTDSPEPMGLGVLNVWFLAIVTMQMVIAIGNEERLYNNKPPVLLPVASFQEVRVLWIFVVVLDVACSLGYIGTPLWPISVFHATGFASGIVIRDYAATVVPRPPGQNKIRQYVDSFFLKPIRTNQ